MKIIIIGGAGTVGTILTRGLLPNHEVVVMDKQKQGDFSTEYIQVDATNLQDLLEKVPEADVIINLLNTETTHAIAQINV